MSITKTFYQVLDISILEVTDAWAPLLLGLVSLVSHHAITTFFLPPLIKREKKREDEDRVASV